jgi:hypothetical protein
MPAFYEGELFTVNMKALPDAAADSNIENNAIINQIVASNDLDESRTSFP